MRSIAAFIGAAVVLLSGCGGPKADLTLNPANFNQPDPIPVEVANSQYRLGGSDHFQLTVFRVPDLSGEYIVEPSGLVQFPLIGDVQVAGLTSTELTELLTRRFGSRYLREPNITVRLTQVTSQVVTVEGAVNNPVNFNLLGDTQLLQAIARAGGTNGAANTRRVVVIRQIDGIQQAAAFDLARIREGLDPNPAIYAGDIVIVDGSQVRQTLRDVLTVLPLIGVFRPLYD